MPHPRSQPLATALLATLILALAAPALAKDPLFGKPFSFRVRNNPVALSRAITMQRAENAGTGSFGSLAGGAGSAMPGLGVPLATATANYSIVNVEFGEDSSGTVMVDTDQDSVGDQTADTDFTPTINDYSSADEQP